MNRRAQAPTIVALLALVAVIIFAGIIGIGSELQSGNLIQKSIASKNIALLLGAVDTSAHDIVVRYPEDLDQYIVEVNQETVVLRSAKQVSSSAGVITGSDPTSQAYAHGLPLVSDDPAYISKPSTLIIQKRGVDLTINDVKIT